MVGGLIMCHGDDRGLRVPPRLAHIQSVVLVIRDEDGAGEAAARVNEELVAAGVRSRLDAQVATPFGRRSTDWELKGVPVRLEIGPRDVAEGQAVLVRRDTGEKTPVPLTDVTATVQRVLEEIQDGLLAEATAMRDERTAHVSTLDEVLDASATGFARVPWEVVAGEDQAAELGAKAVTVRCIQRADGTVPAGEDEGDLYAICARSY